MNFIDTHFHLDLWKNPKGLVSQIEKERIYTIAVTNAPSVYKLTLNLTEGAKYIRPALGYHPEVLNQRPNDYSLFEKYVDSTRYIGEIGLDYACTVDKNQQREIFSKVIERCSKSNNKVITIHSRRAESDCVDIIGNNYPNAIILHWYSGSIRELKKAINKGFYFSVNSQMIKSKNGQQIIKNIPLDKILTESDGPFVSIGNQPSSPLNIGNTVSELAIVLGVNEVELRSNLYRNFHDILV